MFKEIDDDASGALSERNILSALQRAGLEAHSVDAAKMIKMLDKNCDGEITYEEFRKYLVMLPSTHRGCQP